MFSIVFLKETVIYLTFSNTFTVCMAKRSVKKFTLFALTNGHSRHFKLKKLCWVTDFTHVLIQFNCQGYQNSCAVQLFK